MVSLLVLSTGAAWAAQATEGEKEEDKGAGTSVFDIPEDDEWPDTPRPDGARPTKPSPRKPPVEPQHPDSEPDAEPDADVEPAAPRRPPPGPVFPPRAPVPPQGAQAAAERVVRELFAKDYAGRRPLEKAGLAKRLLAEATGEQDPAARYVLLREARDAAAAGGDARRVLDAVRLLSDSFRVSGRRMLLDALTTAGKSDASVSELKLTALALIDLAESDDLSYAAAAAAAADATAKRTRDPAVIPRAKAKLAEVSALAREFPSVQAGKRGLGVYPDDLDGNLEIGRYLCFARGRWAKGLPLLAAGSDPVLAGLAKRELAGPPTLDKRRALAEAWWDASTDAKGTVDADMRARACHWYAKIYSYLTGLARVTAGKHLVEALTPRLRPGLVGRISPTHQFGRGSVERIDRVISFNWGGGSPDDSIPADGFAGLWRGYLKAPLPGKYKLVTRQDDSSRIWVDDKLVIDAWGHGGVHQGEVELTGDPQHIQIEFGEGGGVAELHLGWVLPSGGVAKPVPGTALFHQPRGRGFILRPRLAQPVAFGGHTYAMFKGIVPWPAAKAWCEEMGGRLVIIESEAEQAFLADYVAGAHPWIGMRDEEENGVYKWIEGTLPRFAAWSVGEPHGVPGGNPDDGVILWQGGLWADVDWGHAWFLCEWED